MNATVARPSSAATTTAIRILRKAQRPRITRNTFALVGPLSARAVFEKEWGWQDSKRLRLASRTKCTCSYIWNTSVSILFTGVESCR